MRSELSNVCAEAFEGMEMRVDTVLTGRIMDQPQLCGILERKNGLGLLSVKALPDEARQRRPRAREPEL